MPVVQCMRAPSSPVEIRSPGTASEDGGEVLPEGAPFQVEGRHEDQSREKNEEYHRPGQLEGVEWLQEARPESSQLREGHSDQHQAHGGGKPVPLRHGQGGRGKKEKRSETSDDLDDPASFHHVPPSGSFRPDSRGCRWGNSPGRWKGGGSVGHGARKACDEAATAPFRQSARARRRDASNPRREPEGNPRGAEAYEGPAMPALAPGLPAGEERDKIASIAPLPAGSIQPRRTRPRLHPRGTPCGLPGHPRRGLRRVETGEQHGPSRELRLLATDPIPVI